MTLHIRDTLDNANKFFDLLKHHLHIEQDGDLRDLVGLSSSGISKARKLNRKVQPKWMKKLIDNAWRIEDEKARADIVKWAKIASKPSMFRRARAGGPLDEDSPLSGQPPDTIEIRPLLGEVDGPLSELVRSQTFFLPLSIFPFLADLALPPGRVRSLVLPDGQAALGLRPGAVVLLDTHATVLPKGETPAWRGLYLLKTQRVVLRPLCAEGFVMEAGEAGPFTVIGTPIGSVGPIPEARPKETPK